MRVVVVLSGGGAKAAAHLGAWRALAEAGRHPSQVVATSMGAVLGAALAAGATPDDVAARFRTLRRADFARVPLANAVRGMFAPSVFHDAPLRRTIARLTAGAAWDDLRIPLSVTATELESGDLVVFGEGGRRDVPLADALYASSALPVWYPAARIGGRHFVDGGIRAVLPLGPARAAAADLIVAVNVGSGFDEAAPARPARVPALLRAHGEAERVMMAAQTERELEDWPAEAPRLVVVRPVAEREATFALDQTERYVEAGYATTKAVL